VRRSAFEMLRNPVVTTAALARAVPALAGVHARVLTRLDIEGRYVAHLARQDADLRAFAADEALALDPGIDYAQVEGLSSEVRERLARVRPASLVRSGPGCPREASADVGCVPGRGEADGGHDTLRRRVPAQIRKADTTPGERSDRRGGCRRHWRGEGWDTACLILRFDMCFILSLPSTNTTLWSVCELPHSLPLDGIGMSIY
jgi:hypothetical protein